MCVLFRVEQSLILKMQPEEFKQMPELATIVTRKSHAKATLTATSSLKKVETTPKILSSCQDMTEILNI